MNRARLLVVAPLLCAALGAAPAALAARQGARVTARSDEALYLDKGAAAGLVTGMQAAVYAGRARAGACVVEHVSESFATCRAERLHRRASRVRFSATPRAAEPPVEPSRGTTSEEQRVARRARFRTTTFPKVSYDARARRSSAWRFPASVTLRHQTWTVTPFEDKTFHRERVELALRGASLGLDGLRAFARANVEGRLSRPSTTRFRPDDVARVEVYEAAIGWRPADGFASVKAGRFLPWRIPGVTVLDGAEASGRLFDDALEVGIYGGSVPDLVTGLPSLTRLSAGTFWGAALALSDLRVGHRGRLGVRTNEALSMRAEVEGVVDVSWGRWLFAAAGARAGAGGAGGGMASLDSAFTQARLSAFDVVTVSGGYRWLGPLAFDADPLGLRDASSGGAHHADASARWRVTSWLETAVVTGASLDVGTGTLRGWAGPDLSLPRALFGLGGLDVGYREELGALAGRYAYSRVHASLFERLRASTTLSAWEQPGLYENGRDLSLSSEARLRLLSWLFVDVRGHAHAALPSVYGYAKATPVGMYGELAITGAL